MRNEGTLTEGDLRDGEALCLSNSARLLDSAEVLIDAGQGDHALVFLTLALEEFGKVLMLRTAVTTGTVATTFWQAWRDHRAKFDLAIRALPATALNLRLGLAVETFVGQSRTICYGSSEPQAQISVHGTGKFFDVSSPANVEIYDGLRFELLYVDWDTAARRWKQLGDPSDDLAVAPAFDDDEFLRACTALRTALRR